MTPLDIWKALTAESDLTKREAILNAQFRGLDMQASANLLAETLNAAVDSHRIFMIAIGTLIDGTDEEITAAVNAAVERVAQEQTDSQFKRMIGGLDADDTDLS